MAHFIPRDDAKQALRIKRFLMAFGTYIVWMLIALYCYYDGLFVRMIAPLSFIFSLVISSNILLFLTLRSGLNLRLKDPSLTLAQMILATVWTMVMAYGLDEGRGIMLLLYMVVFTFGTFRLNFRQFSLLSVIALLGYASVITMLLINHYESVNLKVELLYLGTLFTVLIWFSFIGSYINGLRKKLSKSNSELNQANEELSNANVLIRQKAIHDDLTGVYNRGHLFSILMREKNLADRGECMFCVAILDLDDFKKVNDTYGHLAGAMVLRVLCRHVGDNIRKEDYLARYGGEEFVLILTYPDLKEGLVCAERIRNLVSEIRFPGLPDDFRMTFSMGLTQYIPSEDIDTLIKRADNALYRAKLSGKNRIVCDPVRLALSIVNKGSAA